MEKSEKEQEKKGTQRREKKVKVKAQRSKKCRMFYKARWI